MDNNINDKYDELIKEFIEQRDSLKKMITDLEKIKDKVDLLFPEVIDKRFVMFFQEKVKAVTELFRVILDMRKEITKNVKDEFEVRRRSTSGFDDNDFEIFDIKKLADRVEKLRKEKLQIEQKSEVITIENKEEDIPEVPVPQGPLKI